MWQRCWLSRHASGAQVAPIGPESEQKALIGFNTERLHSCLMRIPQCSTKQVSCSQGAWHASLGERGKKTH